MGDVHFLYNLQRKFEAMFEKTKQHNKLNILTELENYNRGVQQQNEKRLRVLVESKLKVI